jgi:hypothetical protein
MTNTNSEPARYLTSVKEGIPVPFIGNNHVTATVTDTKTGTKTEGYGNSASEAQTHAFDKIAKNQ